MSNPVVMNATIMCSMSQVPVLMPITVMNTGKVMIGKMMVANIGDSKPMVNIKPFGACRSPANPAVVKPVMQGPCVPAIVSPWIPVGKPSVMVGKMPVLLKDYIVMCNWGGIITIKMTPATTVNIK